MPVAVLAASAVWVVLADARVERKQAPASEPAGARFHFFDVAPTAGLRRVVHAGRPDKPHLLDSAGTGVAWLDFDRDGYLDVYVVNGWKLDDGTVVEKGRNALYRNRGDGSFEDVTEKSGADGGGQWGCGVTVADYDNDGWPDILVTNFGPNVLYRNRRDGTFENVAGRLGIEVPGWNTGASFFDADRDGDLDLYIAAYVDASLEDVLKATRTLDWKGVDKVAFGPFGLRGAVDHFFLSDGKGDFVEATAQAGLEDRARGFGFAVRASDFDGDGDPDLYVANDSDANYFYRNEGDGTFREIGLWNGTAFNAQGAAQASMGVTVGDADGDGALDIFVTNFSEDFSTLYRGVGKGFFEDATVQAGLGEPTFLPLSWGAIFADLDNDGDQDLVVANGHIYPQVDSHPEFRLSYGQRNLLLENQGQGRFVDVTAEAGPGFQLRRASRALAAGDYDNDGDLDLLFTHLDLPPSLLRNDSPTGSWLTIVLEVPPGAGTAIGAVVRVTAGERAYTRDLASSDSYLSVSDPRLHFGLGSFRNVDRIEVFWLDGTRSLREKVGANQFLTIRKDHP